MYLINRIWDEMEWAKMIGEITSQALYAAELPAGEMP